MAYDEKLAARVRAVLPARASVMERKMFGGLALMLDGKMLCGILGDELIVRVGPERYPEALGKSHARPMDFNGRPMRGYVYVAAAGVKTPKQLVPWLASAMSYVATIDARPRKSRPRKPVLARLGLLRRKTR